MAEAAQGVTLVAGKSIIYMSKVSTTTMVVVYTCIMMVWVIVEATYL